MILDNQKLPTEAYIQNSPTVLFDLVQNYYVFHGRVTLFFANNFLMQRRITMKFWHNFF